jgi:hypothetical protein
VAALGVTGLDLERNAHIGALCSHIHCCTYVKIHGERGVGRTKSNDCTSYTLVSAIQRSSFVDTSRTFSFLVCPLAWRDRRHRCRRRQVSACVARVRPTIVGGRHVRVVGCRRRCLVAAVCSARVRSAQNTTAYHHARVTHDSPRPATDDRTNIKNTSRASKRVQTAAFDHGRPKAHTGT